ncbi:hypothetical protein M5X17_27710 [Paenibacillus alvei]|uniref:hypothetical protein n=1 Tax=Paenibacillus alvei TaxID=44250 RepID=UPI0022832CEE|nr:hypothetical protein [Paenibacillus alvei]MCY9737493.1 hypothetical protein [Paenibacillus alvei]
MLNEHFIINIAALKRGNMDIYHRLLLDMFGRQLSWGEVKKLKIGELYRLSSGLQEEIELDKSPLDVNKLAYTIQGSRSGIGGSAFTQFTCAFCGQEEMWVNTSTPKICIDCATKMAIHLSRNYKRIMKVKSDGN